MIIVSILLMYIVDDALCRFIIYKQPVDFYYSSHRTMYGKRCFIYESNTFPLRLVDFFVFTVAGIVVIEFCIKAFF